MACAVPSACNVSGRAGEASCIMYGKFVLTSA